MTSKSLNRLVVQKRYAISLIASTNYSHSRIIQWTKRGIPAAIKLAYPEIFTTDLKRVS